MNDPQRITTTLQCSEKRFSFFQLIVLVLQPETGLFYRFSQVLLAKKL